MSSSRSNLFKGLAVSIILLLMIVLGAIHLIDEMGDDENETVVPQIELTVIDYNVGSSSTRLTIEFTSNIEFQLQQFSILLPASNTSLASLDDIGLGLEKGTHTRFFIFDITLENATYSLQSGILVTEGLQGTSIYLTQHTEFLIE